MIKINVNKKKTVEFDVNVSGVQCENLLGRLSLFYEGIIYSFPATIEAGNVIKVIIPPLSEVINNIPDKAQADLKLEVVGNETFMLPWSATALLEHPVKVEATMRGGKLVEEESPKVEISEMREEESEPESIPKLDEYSPEFIKSMKKIHKAEKEQKEKKQVEKSIKRHKTKLGEALRGEEVDEHCGKDHSKEKKTNKKLAEELAKTLLNGEKKEE